MMRRLLLIGITCALTVGGWAGALAAVVCPHADAAGAASGGASHDCCRSQDGGGAASCPMRFAKSGDDDQRRPRADDSHGASQASHGEPRAVAVESSRRAKSVAALGPSAVYCAHCVGRRLPPPASTKVSAPEAAKRGDDCEAPRAETLPAPSAAAIVREVIPSQGAPPGAAARLHVLNSVFLI